MGAQLNRVQADSQKLASDYNEEKARLEQRMQELAESNRREAERSAAEYQTQILELQHRLAKTASISVVEKADIVRQLSELRRQQSQGGRGGVFGMIGRALDSVFGL